MPLVEFQLSPIFSQFIGSFVYSYKYLFGNVFFIPLILNTFMQDVVILAGALCTSAYRCK